MEGMLPRRPLPLDAGLDSGMATVDIGQWSAAQAGLSTIIWKAEVIS